MDLLSISYFHKGVTVSKSVGRITIISDAGNAYGTGFMIGGNLMITNNHVMKEKKEAVRSYIEFNYEENEQGFPKPTIAFSFDPDQFFITSEKLDFTIVHVNSESVDRSNSLTEFGSIPMIEKQGKLKNGDFVSIVQHPNGSRKKVALRNNHIIDIFDDFLHYKTDTEPGSSGSPVFNDQWDLVGLHHSGVLNMDERGNILNVNGGIWKTSDGENEISWLANEGVRISSIIKHLKKVATARERIELDRIIIYDTEPITEPPITPANDDFYDKTTDEQRIADYYHEVNFKTTKGVLYNSLNRLLKMTHKKELRYKPNKYVYPKLDHHPDGKLRSIYSGKDFDKDELIRMDKEIEMQRKEKFLAIVNANESLSTEDFAKELDIIEAAHAFNCEHVVPQSWYNKKEPMKGDLHHLFTCEWGCNSFRGNKQYFDFADFDPEEVIRDDCGKREDDHFEPQINKGVVARATLYFLIRYPDKINNNYSRNDLKMLIQWHKTNPVTDYERRRNMITQEMQGNRNPLIDFPEMVDKIDLRKGL